MAAASVPGVVSASNASATSLPRSLRAKSLRSSSGIGPDLAGTSLRSSLAADRQHNTPAPHIVYVRIEGSYAAVEQALRLRLLGKSVLVAHIAQHHVVSASYEAKLQGVHAGMSIQQARAICPGSTILPVDGDRYVEFFHRVRTILDSFALAVDPDAHHGFYLNFFGSPHLSGDFPGMLRQLQLEILKQIGLNVSIGAANSKVAAVVAARLASPGTQQIVAPGAEQAFLAAQNVAVLHGLNGIDAIDLRRRGIATVAELQRVPRPALESAYGDPFGSQLWQNSRGQDVTGASCQPLIRSWWSWLRSALAPASVTP